MGYWSNSGGGSPSTPSKLVAAPTYDLGTGSGGGANKQFADVGKTGLSLPDLPGSIMEGAGNLLGLFGSVGKAATDTIGSIGIPGGPNIGDIPEAVGGAVGFGLGEIGKAELPFLKKEDETAERLGDVPGIGLDVLTAPGRFIEWENAKGRARLTRELLDSGKSYDEIYRATGIDLEIIDAVDSGASIETIAEELVARGAGFSDNPLINLVDQIVLDPVNLIAPGVARGARAVRGAGLALRAGQTASELGLSRTFLGTAYNGLAKGLSTAGSATVGRVVGPATAGVFHALKVAPYKGILKGLDGISPDAAAAFDDALARGVRQFTPATIADNLSDEAELILKVRPPNVSPEAALARLPRGAQLQETLGSIRPKVIREKELIRRTEEKAQRVVPDFHGVPYEQMAAETVRKLSRIARLSEEDALRALGGKVSVEQARYVHLAFYGRAGSDLSQAISASAHAKNIDPERLTIIAPQTLTDERAAALLAGKGAERWDQYEIITRKFASDADWSKVEDYIKRLRQNDALPHQVKFPTSGKNKLPAALSDWRAKYADSGYEIGFGPKDGWKAIVDDVADEIIVTDPFVHFIDEAAPLTVRNPLGRFVDSLMRGTSQTKIVQTAKQRFVKQTAAAGILDTDADRIFGRILDETRLRRATPRSFHSFEYDRFFEDVLGPDAYREYRALHSPTLTVMKAFEGNWREVGITQKITGRAKVWTAEHGNFVAAITEQLYPNLKFRYRPVFQLQELFEAPFFRVTRGIGPTNFDDAASKVMMQMAGLSPEMRMTWEAGATNFLSTGEVVARISKRGGPIGRALGNQLKGGVVGVKERARIAQVFSENGEYFFNTINDVSPRLWKTMTEAYGTTNANEVAKAFIRERFQIIDDRTGNVVKAFMGPAASADEETVMQGFLEAWRQSSRQAFATQYFRPTRGFLERTLNHPYLGLYPLSYMWGKVAPELARFLLVKPFGVDAPLVGALAYNRVREAIMEEQLTNPEFSGFIEKNPDTLNFINMLLPGTPEYLPVNAPAWARHLSRDIQRGREINASWAEREAIDTGVNASPLRDVRDAIRVGEEFIGGGRDLADRLTRAAAEFDGMFNRK